jgi:hypothetical protein
MMTCSEGCGRWAQWRVTAPEKNADGKILRLKTVAILCGEHKNTMQKQAESSDPKVDLRFNFTGTIRDGSYSPQS